MARLTAGKMNCWSCGSLPLCLLVDDQEGCSKCSLPDLLLDQILVCPRLQQAAALLLNGLTQHAASKQSKKTHLRWHVGR